jgi:spermidine/putrescine transport system permease protein
MEDWRKNKRVFWILFLPPTFWLVLFFTIPLAIIWVYSFGHRGPLGQMEITFSGEGYVQAMDWTILYIIVKSIWIAAVATAICLLLGFPLAMGIAFAPARYKNLLLLLVILPFWTNLLIRTYAWIAVLRTNGYVNGFFGWVYGLLDSLLGLLGAPDALGEFQPLQLLYNQQAVIIGIVYVNLPFLVLPLYATLEKLDKSFLEASLDLGAGQWRTLFSVTVPLAWPGIVTGLLLTFILALGSFLTPDLLGGPDSIMIANLIQQQFGPARNWPLGSALSFMLMYVTFLCLWLKAMAAQREGGVSY